MNTLMIITFAVAAPVYALLWHNQDAHPQKEGSSKLERELLWPRRKPSNKHNQRFTLVLFWLSLSCGLAAITSLAAESQFELPLTNSFSLSMRVPKDPTPGVWVNGIGEGFRSTTESVSVNAGASAGFAAFGGKQSHDLALTSISYGHMLGPVCGEDHWYRGNFEGRLELFGGMQFHPDVDTDGWLIGLTPHLRYNFATGTRWVPFVDAGAGVTATGMGAPDLSGTFEFNLQGAVGTHWFIRNNLALTAEARYLHMSCAGTHSPNLGLNTVVGMIGLSWFF